METVMQVTVVESHAIPGGAAHAWVQDGYHFESGPSLYSGMAATCDPQFVPASAQFVVLTRVTTSVWLRTCLELYAVTQGHQTANCWPCRSTPA